MEMDPGIEDQNLPVGCPVYSADDEWLGEVAGVDSGHLRVEATGQPAYWLPLHAVHSASPDRVTLSFAAAQLDSYRQPIEPP
jgi:hypothetical protein